MIESLHLVLDDTGRGHDVSLERERDIRGSLGIAHPEKMGVSHNTVDMHTTHLYVDDFTRSVI